MMSHQGKYQKADEEDGYGKMEKKLSILHHQQFIHQNNRRQTWANLICMAQNILMMRGTKYQA